MEVDYLCLTPTSSKSAAKVNILREQGERKKVKKHKIPTPALPKGGSFTRPLQKKEDAITAVWAL
jgi:hypothetical protein